MLNLSTAQRVVVVGGGTAGWLAALEMRRTFPGSVEVILVESEAIGIIGAGEGTVPNFLTALDRYGIDPSKFITETQATFKLGVEFTGWRGAGADDVYHHLFSFHSDSADLSSWRENGTYPLMSGLVAEGLPIAAIPATFGWIKEHASQTEVLAGLSKSEPEGFAYHFDAQLVARFLRSHAESQGVRRINATVSDVVVEGQGRVAALVTDSGTVEADFFIDSTGLARVVVHKKLGVAWESFAEYLIVDSALPFLLPHDQPNPPLVTRSVAMNAGWMWVIPTGGRLGCGYVYSSAYISTEQALAELEQHWQKPIKPINHIRFSPGCLKRCWVGNAMAIGLSSGFVEPLEATSIGQTIDQLVSFGELLEETGFLIPDQLINTFNGKVSAYWDGILDFLVLHYDTSRSDSPFWRRVQALPKPARYLELKFLFQDRLAREVDLIPYELFGKHLFGIASWISVGAAMGVMSPEAAARDLAGLDGGALDKVQQFVAQIRGGSK